MRRVLSALLVLVGLPFACTPRSTAPEEAPSKGAEGASSIAASEFGEDLVALTSEAFGGRAAGSPGGQLAAAYLEGRLEGVGLRPLTSEYRQPFTATRRISAIEAVNLVAVVPNRHLDQPAHSVIDCPHPMVVLTAHFDHLGTRRGDVFNGADDNASGVAVALRQAAKSVGDDPPFHLVLALLDAEELGLQGARALLNGWDDAVRERIVANLNLDMVGRSDAQILWIAGGYHTPWVAAVIDELEQFTEVEVRGGRDSSDSLPDWTESSDHAVFHRAGIPFLYFGVDDHADYHRSSDDLERLDLSFMDSVGQVVELALVGIEEHLGDSRASSSP